MALGAMRPSLTDTAALRPSVEVASSSGHATGMDLPVRALGLEPARIISGSSGSYHSSGDGRSAIDGRTAFLPTAVMFQES